MRHQFSVTVGPVGFRIGAAWADPVQKLRALYADYPDLSGGIPDFTVRLEPEKFLRRWIRPSVAIRGDFTLPDAFPMSLQHGLLAAEMGMNLQMAMGQRKYLLLHAASVERDGKVLIITGESGAGKSTLSALLGEHGWRFMGDEFALIDPETGLAHPFPRPVSLKNQAVAVMAAAVGADRLGPEMKDTPKGDIRHLKPNPAAIAAMQIPGKPALILFPRFGHDRAVRMMGLSEVFVRLTQASTNYVYLGERGYSALTSLVTQTPVRAIDYPDTASALDLVETLWGELA
jgi:HprK-related kinase A